MTASTNARNRPKFTGSASSPSSFHYQPLPSFTHQIMHGIVAVLALSAIAAASAADCRTAAPKVSESWCMRVGFRCSRGPLLVPESYELDVNWQEAPCPSMKYRWTYLPEAGEQEVRRDTFRQDRCLMARREWHVRSRLDATRSPLVKEM